MPEPEAIRKPATTYVVSVADMKLSDNPGDRVITHALGSCLGIALYDANTGVGGILHYMLPLSRVNPGKAKQNPWMFADTGIPAFFRAAVSMGAQANQLKIVLVGGAQLIDASGFYAIGERNLTAARDLLKKNRLAVHKEHAGGTIPRTLILEIGSGRMCVKCQGREIEL